MEGRSCLDVDYILPLKWTDDSCLGGLVRYLELLAAHVRVIVVDGSREDLYSAHASAFLARVRHCRPKHPECLNGKVDGVLTGLDLAGARLVIIADDDVRYTLAQLYRIVELLQGADVVRPQNYFPSPMPWHARWDTGRTLLNRALGADYPGTMALRTRTLEDAGGYSGDVLFENLELLRTVRAAGGKELHAPDLFVARLPCSTAHFLRQRVRQAYDDFAQPLRLTAELALLPALVWCARRPVRLLPAAAAVVVAAECGRRRNGGQRVFSPTAALWAPLWLIERAVCVWVAMQWRLRGGIPYAGTRLRTAAHSVRRLRRTVGGTAAASASAGT